MNTESNRSGASAWMNRLREGNVALVGGLLFVLVTLAFLPALRNGFVNIDDGQYIAANVHVQPGLTWAGVRWAFTTLHMGFWHPLTWLSIMLDCQVFGPRAWGHHLTSILLHAANTALLFFVLCRLTEAPWRSAFVALLFGLHPLHVESVVWAAERKDVLSAFFFMLTLWAYTHYAEQPKPGVAEKSEVRDPKTEGNPKTEIRSLKSAPILRFPASIFYLLALVFFVLGLMSKTMLVTVPVVLLLLDFWPLRRTRFFAPEPQSGTGQPILRLVLEKLPFVIPALLAGLATMLAQQGGGALVSAYKLPLLYRVANALLSYVHYLIQMVWPARLAVYYVYPRGFSIAAVAIAVVLLGAISAAACLKASRRPYFAFGWAWYILMLLPAIGLIQVGAQAQADRYTYLPLIGIFMVVVWGICDLTARSRSQPIILAVAGCAAVALCIAVTYRQIGFWKNSETLFNHALSVTHDNYRAHNHLGATLFAQKKVDEALLHFQESVRLAPEYAVSQDNLGAALSKKGRLEEATVHFREAVRLKPDLALAHCNLGIALGKQGHLDEAITELQQALKLDPNLADAQHNLQYAQSLKAKANTTRTNAPPKPAPAPNK